ncbi:MAG: hypothetical protein H7066_15440 [Cytophagaceae bacterium]|nr:hypothetical protein [Gemmatimonadaceae bacterium]
MGSELASALRSTALEWRATDRRYTLEADGWRSFQPIQNQEGGDPVIVVVRLHADTAIPDSVSVLELQFVKDDVVWAPPHVSEVRREAGSSTMELVVRNGPGEWAPGDSVDVIARLRDGGATSLVRAPRFVIARVD